MRLHKLFKFMSELDHGNGVKKEMPNFGHAIILNIPTGLMGWALGYALYEGDLLTKSTATIIAVSIGLIPAGVTLIAFIIAGLMDLVSLILAGPRYLIQKIRPVKKAHSFDRIDKKKIEPFALSEDVEELHPALIGQVCEEIVRDQLGRALEEVETVAVLKSLILKDGTTLVIFRYRRHLKSDANGAVKDRLHASVHMVRLTLNKVCQSVEIENSASFDAHDLKGIQNPLQFLESNVEAYTGSVMSSLPEITLPTTEKQNSMTDVTPRERCMN